MRAPTGTKLAFLLLLLTTSCAERDCTSTSTGQGHRPGIPTPSIPTPRIPTPSITVPKISVPTFPRPGSGTTRPPSPKPTSAPATTSRATSPPTTAARAAPATTPATSTRGGRDAHRPAFHAPAFHGPDFSPDGPFGDFFTGFSDTLAAAVTGLTAGFMTVLLGMIAAFFTVGLSFALLPILLITGVLGALFAGLFGWLGVLFAVVFGVIALITGQLLVLMIVMALTLLFAAAGASGLAIGLLAAVIYLLRRSRGANAPVR